MWCVPCFIASIQCQRHTQCTACKTSVMHSFEECNLLYSGVQEWRQGFIDSCTRQQILVPHVTHIRAWRWLTNLHFAGASIPQLRPLYHHFVIPKRNPLRHLTTAICRAIRNRTWEFRPQGKTTCVLGLTSRGEAVSRSKWAAQHWVWPGTQCQLPWWNTPGHISTGLRGQGFLLVSYICLA